MYTSSPCFRFMLSCRSQEPWEPLSTVAKKLIETTEILRVKRNGYLIYVTPGEVRKDDVVVQDTQSPTGQPTSQNLAETTAPDNLDNKVTIDGPLPQSETA